MGRLVLTREIFDEVILFDRATGREIARIAIDKLGFDEFSNQKRVKLGITAGDDVRVVRQELVETRKTFETRRR